MIVGHVLNEQAPRPAGDDTGRQPMIGTTTEQTASTALGPGLAGATGQPRIQQSFAAILATLWHWYDRWYQRRQLESLPQHMLKDLGLSSADAYREASKPFWRA